MPAEHAFRTIREADEMILNEMNEMSVKNCWNEDCGMGKAGETPRKLYQEPITSTIKPTWSDRDANSETQCQCSNTSYTDECCVQNINRFRNIQSVKKLRLQRFRDDRGGKNKHVFYLTKLWLMHRFAARWSYG